MKIATKWSIGDTVWVEELKVKARVLAVYISETGMQYSCRWFQEKDMRTGYLYECELGPNKPEDRVCFKAE